MQSSPAAMTLCGFFPIVCSTCQRKLQRIFSGLTQAQESPWLFLWILLRSLCYIFKIYHDHHHRHPSALPNIHFAVSALTLSILTTPKCAAFNATFLYTTHVLDIPGHHPSLNGHLQYITPLKHFITCPVNCTYPNYTRPLNDFQDCNTKQPKFINISQLFANPVSAVFT